MQNLLEVLRKTDFVLLERQYQTVDGLAGERADQFDLSEEQDEHLEAIGNFFYSLMVAAGKDGLPVPEWVNPPRKDQE